MDESSKPEHHRPLLEALDHLRRALDLLDSAGAPAQIGARVDHAIHDLYDAIGARDGCGRPGQIDRNAASQ
jgi:hypothetical protein